MMVVLFIAYIYINKLCMEKLQVAIINNVYYVTIVSDRPHLC